ncbi:unnamed protein product [Ambrosiozyma monospora]|uniref:Unnamed protein product n=1 Tax=Ambrosiozyma monospora TaxID=43982 RepID=A0ACB5TDV9_AMBMO|nr:unnamed protein product [Ambrosiozyma monospora]
MASRRKALKDFYKLQQSQHDQLSQLTQQQVDEQPSTPTTPTTNTASPSRTSISSSRTHWDATQDITLANFDEFIQV